jgi:hypothetical protein
LSCSKLTVAVPFFFFRGIQNLCPSQELAYYVSVCIVTLLTSVPLLYAGLTILSLPSHNSLETVVDVYSQEIEVTNFKQQEIDSPDSDCKVTRSEQQEVVE